MKNPLTKLQKQVLESFFTQPIGKSYFLDQKVHFGDIKTFGKVKVDSIENIGSNKITAIFGRTEAKDFIDLYFILKKKLFTFEKLLNDAKKKDLGLSEFYLAHMLLEVRNTKNFPEMPVSFNKGQMENYFVSIANKLLLDVKPKEV